MADNPVIYQTLLLQRLGDEIGGTARAICDPLDQAYEAMRVRAKERVLTCATHAYAEGLRDGFTQGVGAECARRDGDTAVSEYDEGRLTAAFRDYVGRCAAIGFDTMLRLLTEHFEKVHGQLHGQDFASAYAEANRAAELVGASPFHDADGEKLRQMTGQEHGPRTVEDF